jgi:putative toxin-antitoxin system antitoxin component (TIGR02293 family)
MQTNLEPTALTVTEAQRIGERAGLFTSEIVTYLGISDKTFSRRVERGRLEPAESMRIEMIERTLKLAEELLGDPDRARAYLHAPLIALKNRSPLQVLTSIAGYERVRDSLYAQAYGMF